MPPTSALVAIMFGPKYLGMLMGIVFFSHQIGAFLGAYLGGLAYDRFGDYQLMWLLAAGLGIIAALLHLPVSERRLAAPAPA